MTDYSLWEVILNGDSLVPTRVVEGVLQPVAPTTAEQMLARKNELKAREIRGNIETKKVQKTLLKQQFENFTGSSSKSLDQIHDKLQKLVSQLEIHGVSLSQEDANLKFFCSLPSEWKTHTLIWRNKAGEEQSLDDFTTDPVSAAASVSAVCAKLSVSSLPNVDSLSNAIDVDDHEKMDLRWQMAMLTMRARRFLQKTGRNLGANGPTSMGFDMSKVECYNCHRKGHFASECRSPNDSRRTGTAEPHRRTVKLGPLPQILWSLNVMVQEVMTRVIKQRRSLQIMLLWLFHHHTLLLIMRGGYHAVPPSITETFMPSKPDLVFNTAPTAVETDHHAFNVQLSPTKPEQDLSHTTRPSAPIIEDWPIETSIPAATPASASPKSTSSGKKRNRKTCFVCKSVDHLIKDCDYHAKKMAQPTQRNYAHRVLPQSKPVFNIAVRPVSAVVPRIMVTRPRLAHPIVTKSKSPIIRHITRSPSLKTSNSPPRVTVAQAPVVSAAQGVQGKWGNPQHALKDKGVIDSGCSRHMTGNMSYLSNFEELNGGYVSFGGNPKGGKISGKGKIKTCKLDFEDVYFIKELKFNLFSISQMCDKKNSVLFTDTECLVLSSDFKLPDESQVLLRVPRENNMYNVNLKNIVSSGDLTCLFAKATIDESNLWHSRLGYINFKTINKLVKGNLVRGLPTKVFENDNTCVACKKGKQHRASCKTKPVSSVDQPLFRLHMDLFGPTFVKSLNKKSYCLVVTDDYSRFNWVFFLATKDDTSPILKTFITGLENQLSLKELKGNSVYQEPLQNGTAERKNRTLIEAARTMLADLLPPIPFWAEAVNTACYVQNRVLVTKPHNKTPYELLHGRSPSIGFMRPFGCPVTILNTLESLGKFEGKVDEGFLVGYSVNSKAFRLFDIDSLTRTMNYQPVNAGNQTNPSAGFQDKFNAEKAEEEIDQQYVLFPMWSSGSTNPQNNNEDAVFDGKEHDFDVKKHESEVIFSLSSSAQSRKQDDKTNKEAKGNSPVEFVSGYRDLNAEFEDCSDNSSNEVNAAGSIVPTVG
nr:putative ribonuclease H-like domain-containing protein [Tanacetum cinerariifolium]